MIKLCRVHSHILMHPWVRKMFFRFSLIGKLVFHLVSSLSRGRGINIFPEKEVRHGVKSCQRQTEKGNDGFRHQNPGFFLPWDLSFRGCWLQKHPERCGGTQVSGLFPPALKGALVHHGIKFSKAGSNRRAMEEEGDSRCLRLCSCLLVIDKQQGPGQEEEIALSKEKPEDLAWTQGSYPSQSQMSPPFTQMPPILERNRERRRIPKGLKKTKESKGAYLNLKRLWYIS